MAIARRLGPSFLSFLPLILIAALHAQSGDIAAIQEKLNGQIKVTTTAPDRSDIVQAGDVVEIRAPGLMMYDVASPLPPSNTFKNGKIGQGWSGFGKDLVIGMAAPGGATADSYSHRPFAVGEKCWVTAIAVQHDGVSFQLYSDPYDNIRYYANLKIPFPSKKTAPTADAAAQIVAQVLTVAQAESEAAQAGPPPPVEPPPPAHYDPIPPPPPPADVAPPTISRGETMDQISAGFGQPVRVAKLGIKTVFYYKDMKVTFISGKVTNVD